MRSETPPPVPSVLEEVAENDDPTIAAAHELIRFCDAELAARPDPLAAARLHYEMAWMYERVLDDRSQASIHYDHALSFAPEHLPSIQGARRVQLALERYREVMPLFDAEVRITSDPHRKAMLLYQKGCVLENLVKDASRARSAYLAALDYERSNAGILKAIERIYRAAEDHIGLQQIYEALPHAVTHDPRHRAQLIIQRARYLPASKQEEVADLFESALRLHPDLPGALESLERIYQASGRWRELISALERLASLTEDHGIRAAALYRIGRLHEQKLNEKSEAISALFRAAEVAPNDQLIRDELARLFQETDDWESMARLLKGYLENTEDLAEKVSVWHRLGQLYEHELGDDDEAIRCYSQSLELEPSYVPGLQALGKLYARRDDWLSLIAMHTAEAEASSDAQRRATAHARIAEIYETRLKRPVDAAEHHAKTLALVPGHPAAFKALVRLYSQAGLHRDLIELYERAVDDAPNDAHRTTYLYKIGAIWEDSLGDPSQADHAFRRILELDPKNLGAIHALQRVTERAGRFEALVEALELEVSHTKEKHQKVALLHRAGTVLDEQLGDREAALLRLRKALELNPRFVPALASLGRIYYRLGRWHDLLDMYRRELGVTGPGPAAVALLIRMGELCETKLGLSDEAIKHYRAAAEMDPTHQPALRAWERKLIEKNAWAELPRMFELELGVLSDRQARAVTHFRIGRVYETRLGDPMRAIAAYEKAVGEVEDYRPAIDAIVRLRSGRRAWAQLVEDLARDERTTRDRIRVAGALLRQAEIWRDHISDLDRAIACFEALLDVPPGHLAALLALEELYTRAQKWEALAMVYRRQAEVFEDPGAKVAALRELARVQEQQGVGDDQAMIDTYEQILAIEPDDELALNALAQHGHRTGNRVLLTRVEARLGATAEDDRVAGSHFTVLARTLETVDPLLAMEAYSGALGKEPTLIAVRGIAQLARGLDDVATLVSALRREAQLTLQRDRGAELLVESARLGAERLADTEGALEDLRRALDLDPGSSAAAASLTEILQESGRLDELVDELSRAAGAARSKDRAAGLWLQVADLYANRLDNLGAAIATLTRALKTSPGHVATMARLAELYTENRQWSEAAQLLEKVLASGIDRVEAMRAHVGLAAICHEQLGDLDRAMEHLQKVLVERADHPAALSRLMRIELARGNSAAARSAASELIEVAESDRDRAAAHVQIARLEIDAGDEDAAMQALSRAIEIEGTEGEGAVAFKSMCQRADGWQRYANAVRNYLARPERGRDLAPAFLELAMVQADKLDNLDSAVATLERGLEETRESSTLAVELATRLRWAGRVDEAIGHLRRLLAKDVTRVDTWRALAITLEAAGRTAESRLALAPLVVLGEATAEEERAAGAKQSSSARPGSFDLSALRTISVDSCLGSAATGVLTSLFSAFPKLFPGNLERFSLNKRDRISSRAPNALRTLADEMASVFRVPDYDLYVHGTGSPLISLEAFDPVAVVVSKRVAKLPEPLQRFLLARAMMLVGARIYPVDTLGKEQLALLLAAAGRSVVSGFGAGMAPDARIEELSSGIHKAVARKHRRNAEEAARYFVASPTIDVSSWMKSLQETALRAAMLLADDIAATLELTGQSGSKLSGAKLIASSPLAAELLRFWISERAMEVRRRAGLLPIGR